jgi:hypothetical protein
MIFFVKSQVRPKTLKIDITAITLFDRLCSGEGMFEYPVHVMQYRTQRSKARATNPCWNLNQLSWSLEERGGGA